jgi:DmsE family decaheme c-type cytochrome
MFRPDKLERTTMKQLTRWGLRAASVLVIAGMGIPSIGAAAASDPLAAVPPPDAEYAGGGIETCVDCHDESSEFPVLSILKTKHAVQADLRTPFSSDEGCEICHGPSLAHSEDSDVMPARRFGIDSRTSAEEQNAVCMSCHKGGTQMNWVGSTHDSEDVPCVACHTIHTDEDPVLEKNTGPALWARDTQAKVCFTCHQDTKAKSFRLSSHPLKEGKSSCTGCHNPHGSMGPNMLAKPTVTETCYQCHAEKRGPFLWEHEPVREDCSNCHDPHGSNHRPMLRARGPWLCQQCHSASYHPSTGYTGSQIAGLGNADDHLLASNCMNCHPEVHGSNHPSGARWTR